MISWAICSGGDSNIRDEISTHNYLVMVALPTRAKQNTTGPRPIKLHRDTSQVVELLAVAFDLPLRRAHNYYQLVPEFGYGALVNRLKGQAIHPPGFVWEENGRIVANVSFIPTNTMGYYFIANVGVHPNFRRQGIAYRLMEETIQWARQHHEQSLFLQVDEKNIGAIHLYEALGFDHMGAVTTWRNAEDGYPPRLTMPPLRRNPDEFEGFTIQPLGAEQWREAYALDTRILGREFGVPSLLKPDLYKRSWRNWWQDFLLGTSSENWAAVTPSHELIGLAQIKSEWARPHTLKLRLHPDWQERATRPLLAKLLRRLRYLGRANISLPHPTADATAHNLFSEARLIAHQTLLFMRLDLN